MLNCFKNWYFSSWLLTCIHSMGKHDLRIKCNICPAKTMEEASTLYPISITCFLLVGIIFLFAALVVYNYLLTSQLQCGHRRDGTGEAAWKKKSPCSLVVTWEQFYNPSTLAQQASVWRSPYIASSCLGGNMVLPAPDKYLRAQRLFELERS